MAEFQRFQEAPQFNPMSIIESGEKVAEQGKQIVEALQTYQGQLVQRDQNRVEDSAYNQNTDVLKALGNFSTSAAKTVETIEKQNAKNREVDAQYQTIYNPEVSPEELSIYETADRQQATAGAAANELEAEGDDLGAEALRKDLNRVGQGMADEKALLIDARGAYPGEVLEIINSNDQLAQLYNQNPAIALQIAAKMFIENRGLQYTTKNAFVEILADTIRQTNGYLAQGQISAKIKEEKDVRKAELLNSAVYNGSIATAETAAYDFQMMSRQLLEDNNGIITRGGANAAAAKAMLQGAANVSDDQISIIANIPVKLDEPNTTIGSTYAQDVQKARLDYQVLKGKQDRAFRENLTNSTLEKLKDPAIDPATRAQAVQDAAEELEARGDYIGAYELRAKSGQYSSDPEANANFVRLQQSVAQGTFTPTDEYLNEQVASGQLTQTAATSIRTQRDKRFESITEESKTSQKVTTAFVNSQLKTVIGAQFDPTTGQFNLDSGYRPLDKGTVKALSEDYRGSLKAHMDRFVLTLDPNMDPASYRQALNAEAEKFYEEQTQKPSGDFWMGGLFTYDSRVQEGTPEAEAIKQAGRKYGSFGTPPVEVSGKDLSLDFDPSIGVTPEFKSKFTRGDAVYTQGEAEQINGAVEAGLGFPPNFVQTARLLDMTPLELLNSHMVRYGYPTKADIPEDKFPIPDLTGSRPGTASYRRTAIAGIHALMGQGFSPQAASIMSAYLYVKSGEGRNHTLRLGEGTHTFDKGFIDKIIQGATPQELDILRNPTATPRQILKLMPKDKYNKNLVNYANDLLTQAGIN